MAGVGVAWGVADLVAGAEFDELALAEDGDVGGEIANERHGMRDEEVSEGEVALQVTQQVDDLRADRDVESGDRLVEDEDLGTEGKGAGDIDALALASGKLVRVAGHCGIVEADLAEEFLAAAAALRARLASWAAFMDDERLGDDLLDAHARVEGGVGVLKDRLHTAAQRAEFVLGNAGDGVAVEGDRAGGGLHEAEDDARDGALAGAGFADEAQGFTAFDREGDAVDDGRGVFCVGFDEVARDEERHLVKKLTGAASD